MRRDRVVGLVAVALLASGACGQHGGSGSSGGDRVQPEPATPQPVELKILFSSEKKDWTKAALAEFAASPQGHLADGRPINVVATYGGSVEPIADIVAGRNRVHVFSPASSLVIPLLNDAWVGAHGATARPVAGPGEQLLLSPVILAMWKPMAEALGWGREPLGWADLARFARDPGGWSTHGHPEWGAFKFGHTHPGFSNSGLISVLAETYAAQGKVRDLTEADVRSDQTREFVRSLESSVVHYGRSTGFFYDELAGHGPAYLSAAVLYENLVVTSDASTLPFPLVCVYPEEGTMWADHPYVVLDAEWVGPAEREAAGKLREFLLSRPMQQMALSRFGFRPANTDVPLGAPIDAAHGADPREPQTLLATPDTRTLQAVIDSWNTSKRRVSVVVVFDRSGSMEGPRLSAAKEGLLQFLRSLQGDDRVQLVTFSSEVDDSVAPAPPAQVVARASSIFAEGQTALYDAVDRARTLADQDARRDRTRIHAVVVLTDGEDTSSHLSFESLLPRLGDASEGSQVRIFTIGYGSQASQRVLKGIAERAGGAFYAGDENNIRAVYDEIASFF